MAYKHILIAVDLSPESKVLVEKAVSMARPYNAKVSLIHVDVNYSDLYTGLIDVNLGDMQKRISEETHHALTELSTNAGYPITETLSGSGDLGQVLVDAIKKYDMDLVVCGHHQDFWSKLMSSARQLINTVHVDMLIVPLRDEEESSSLHDVCLNARICGRFAFWRALLPDAAYTPYLAYDLRTQSKSPANTTFNTIIFSIISVISWLFSVVIVY